MCTPPAGSPRDEEPSSGKAAGMGKDNCAVPAAAASESKNPEFPCAFAPWLAANTTCCRWYGAPEAVRVVSALAMLAATTSARIRSACRALPEISISPNRFIHSFPPRLLVRVNGVHHSLVLLAQQ